MSHQDLKERLYQISPNIAVVFNEYDELHSFLQGKGISDSSFNKDELMSYFDIKARSRLLRSDNSRPSEMMTILHHTVIPKRN